MPRRIKRIGLSGEAGHGKSTIAEMLVEDFGFHRRALADKLKGVLGMGLRDTDEQQAIRWVNRNKEHFRPLLQAYGMLGRKLAGEDYWVDEVIKYMDILNNFGSQDVSFVVDDVRFPNEVRRLRERGFRIFRVFRPDAPRILKKGEDTHISENSLSGLEADVIVVNDGDFSSLQAAVNCLLHNPIPSHSSGHPYYYYCSTTHFSQIPPVASEQPQDEYFDNIGVVYPAS